MDLSLMTQSDLYRFLKEQAPELAVNKMRARRSELEGIIKSNFEVEKLSQPKYKPLPKRNKTPAEFAANVLSNTSSGEVNTVDRPKGEPPKPTPLIHLSAKEREELNKMFDDLKICTDLLKHLRLSPERLSGLVGLAAGVDPQTVVKVLETLNNLGDIFAPNRHHHVVERTAA